MQAGFGEVAEKLRRSTVQVFASGGEPGSGSGVICSADGVIVTNAHVARAMPLGVELWDGRRFPATLETRDTRQDLARLRIAGDRLEAASLRDSRSLRIGELVAAIGNPLGFVGALSTGVVHAVGPLRGAGSKPWVQAAVRLAPGNSGGPLADVQGRVVGINTMIASGLALAVPSNAVSGFLLRHDSPVALGVVVRPVTLRGFRAQRFGLMILEVVEGSPAQRASLFPGDILLAAGGEAFENSGDLEDAIAATQEGVLRLRFLRGNSGAVREVHVALQNERAAAA